MLNEVYASDIKCGTCLSVNSGSSNKRVCIVSVCVCVSVCAWICLLLSFTIHRISMLRWALKYFLTTLATFAGAEWCSHKHSHLFSMYCYFLSQRKDLQRLDTNWKLWIANRCEKLCEWLLLVYEHITAPLSRHVKESSWNILFIWIHSKIEWVLPWLRHPPPPSLYKVSLKLFL